MNSTNNTMLKIDKRRTPRFIILTMLTIFLGYGFNLIFTKFYSNHFLPADFGFLRLALSTIVFLSGLNNLNIAGAIIRYGNPIYLKSEKNHSGSQDNLIMSSLLILVTTTVIIAILIAVLAISGFNFLGEINSEFILLIIIIILFPKVVIYFFISWGLAQQDYTYLIYNGLVPILEIVLSIVLVLLFKLEIIGILIVYLLVDGFFSLVGLLTVKKSLNIAFISTKSLRSILKYSGPTFIVAIGLRLIDYIPIFLLNMYSTTEAVAFFSVAVSSMFILKIIQNVRTSSLASTEMQIYDSQGDLALLKFIGKASRIYLSVFFGISLVVYQLSPIIITIITNEQYIYGIQYVPYLVIGLCANAVHKFLETIAKAKRSMVKLSIAQFCAAIIGILAMIVLVPFVGSIGVGMGFAVFHLCQLIFVYLITKQMMNIRFNKIIALKLLFLIIISEMLFEILITLNMNPIFSSFFCCMLYGILNILWGTVKISEIQGLGRSFFDSITSLPVYMRINHVLRRKIQ